MQRRIIGLAAAAAMLAAPLAASAQSLDATLEQIRAALSLQASTAWEAAAHDSAPAPGGPVDWTYERRVEIGDVVYDPTRCTLGLRYRVLTNGAVTTELAAGSVALGLVTAVRQPTEAALVEARDAKAGHGGITTRLDPEIYDVELVRSDGHDNVFSFYDEAVAKRVAQLFEHAVALCAPQGATAG